ncbi:MAG: DUF5067 domain-containing protein [Atopobiaceae bacterium]|nr:DUF5067 domain-containing protein [Atopobiaceae bacterium]
MRTNKRMAVLMAGVLSLALWGCGGSSNSSSSASSSANETKEEKTVEQPKEEAEQKTEEKAPQSKVAVTIDGATLGQDYDGNPAAIVTYTFTNVSSENAENFLMACYAQVYQNGVECEPAFVLNLEGDSSTNVKAGASYTFQQAYSIKDNSPIEIEVKEAFSLDSVMLASATFKFE